MAKPWIRITLSPGATKSMAPIHSDWNYVLGGESLLGAAFCAWLSQQPLATGAAEDLEKIDRTHSIGVFYSIVA